MTQFAYSFCLAMLHSLWQSALLLILYVMVNSLIHKNNAPLAKRNFLYLVITAQLLLFASTFLIYFVGTAGFGSIANGIQSLTASLDDSAVKMLTPWVFGMYVFIIAGKLFKAFYTWYRFKILFKNGL